MAGSSARQVALTFAVGTVIAGCSSDGNKPQTLPTLSAPATVEMSPTPATPSPPATADASAAGVEAFIKSYYAEINHAIRTGDVSALTTYSVPTCSCRRLVDSIRQKSVGSRIIGGKFTLREVVPHDLTPTLARARVLFDVDKAQVVKTDGTIAETIAAAPGARDDISLVRESDRWLVLKAVEIS